MRYKVTLAYDGTDFSGFQVQPQGRTIQGEVEQVLQKVARGTFVRLHPSGRTDAGVHATGQVFHFDWPLARPLAEESLQKALNVLLPPDIQVRDVSRVADTFHARYDAVAKTYRYSVQPNSANDPFTRHLIYHHPYALDHRLLEEGLMLLSGRHDFLGFASAKSDKEDKVRTLYEARLEEQTTGQLDFIFSGDGFLYNMVRLMMGALLVVGDGRMAPEVISEVLATGVRPPRIATAAAHGLYLERVYYEAPSFVTDFCDIGSPPELLS